MRIRKNLKSIPFLVAALWAAGMSLYLLITPRGGAETTAVTVNPEGTTSFFQATRHLTFYGAEGAWGVTLLILFAVLYIATGALALWRRLIILAVMSLAAAALTVITSLSIGLLYFPALYAVIIGWIIVGIAKMIRMSQQAAGDDAPAQPE
jgi:hypothetical protein